MKAIELDIEVHEIMLEKEDKPLTMEELSSAWEEYTKPLDRDFDKKRANYEKARTALMDSLLSIIDDRNEVYKMRMRCRDAAEQYACDYSQTSCEDLFKVHDFEIGEAAKDLDFFRRIGIIDGLECMKLSQAHAQGLPY